MICKNCKREIKEGSKFCEFCGSKQEIAEQSENAQATPEQSAQPQMAQEPVQPQTQGQYSQPQMQAQPGVNPQMYTPKPPKKPMNKKVLGGIIGGGCAALILLIVVVVLVVTHKDTIDLQEYTKVEFSGYNGYGTAAIKFDSEKFWKDISEHADFDSDASSSMDSLSDIVNGISNTATTLYAGLDVDYKLNKDSKLSNNDAVKVEYEFDNDKVADLGIKFAGETKSFKVKGLKKVEEIDAFKDLTVKFDGTSPNAYVTIDEDSSIEAYRYISFSADKTSEIAKGDKVTVTAAYDKDVLLEQCGCTLKTDNKEYECENVDEYVTKYEDISQDYMESTIKEQAVSEIKAYFAENTEELKLGALKFEGCYFLNSKTADTWNNHNYLEVVYSANVKSKTKAFKTTKVYFPVEFKDIQRYADGTYYVSLDYTEIMGNTDLSFGWFSSVKGYTKQAQMYNNLVATKKADYTDESTDSLK